MSSPGLPRRISASPADAGLSSHRSRKRIRQESSDSSGGSESEPDDSSDGGYSVALRNIRRQILALKRDEATRYLGTMAHLDALGDAVTDIANGRDRNGRRSRKRRKRERAIILGDDAVQERTTGAIQEAKSALGSSVKGREVVVSTDKLVLQSGQALDGQPTDISSTPSPLRGLDSEAPHNGFSVETQGGIKRVPPGSSVTAEVASDMSIDERIRHLISSVYGQNLTSAENGVHEAPRTTHSQSTDSEFESKRTKIYFIRHRVQKALLPSTSCPTEEPNDVILIQMAEHFAKLEGFTHIEEEIFQYSKIHKVMREIDKLPSVPGDNKYHFKRRAHDLLLRWKKPLAIGHGSPLTSDSTTDALTPSGEGPVNRCAQPMLSHAEPPHAMQSLGDTLGSQAPQIQRAAPFQEEAVPWKPVWVERVTGNENETPQIKSVDPKPRAIKGNGDDAQVRDAPPASAFTAESNLPQDVRKAVWLREAISYLTMVQPKYIQNPTVHSTVVRILDDYKNETFELNSLIKKCLHLFSGPPHLRVDGFKAKTTLHCGLVTASDVNIPNGAVPGPVVVRDMSTIQQNSDTNVDPTRAKEPGQTLPATKQHRATHSTGPPADPRTPTRARLPGPQSIAPIATMVARSGSVPRMAMSEKARGKQRMPVDEDIFSNNRIPQGDRQGPSDEKTAGNAAQLSSPDQDQDVPSTTLEDTRRKQLEADEALARSLATAWESSQIYERHDEEVARHLQEKYNDDTYDSENDMESVFFCPPGSVDGPFLGGDNQGRQSDGKEAVGMPTRDTEMKDAPAVVENSQYGGHQSQSDHNVKMSDVGEHLPLGIQNNNQSLTTQSQPAPVIQDDPFVLRDAITGHGEPPRSHQDETETASMSAEDIGDGIRVVDARPVQTKATDWDPPHHQQRKRRSLPWIPEPLDFSSPPFRNVKPTGVPRPQLLATRRRSLQELPGPQDSISTPFRNVRSTVAPLLRLIAPHPRTSSGNRYRNEISSGEENYGGEGESVENSRLKRPRREQRDERASSRTASPTPFEPSPTASKQNTASQIARIGEGQLQNTAQVRVHKASRIITSQQQFGLLNPTAAAISMKFANSECSASVLLKRLNENYPADRSIAPDNPIFFSRPIISQVIGGGRTTSFISLKGNALGEYETPIAVFMKKSLNILCPSAAMEHGIIITTRTCEWPTGKTASLFCHRQGSDWEYVGVYRLLSWSKMKKEEWNDMPDRFRVQWAQHITDKCNASKSGWSSRMLREAGFLKDPPQAFDYEDIMDLFTKDDKPKLRLSRGQLRCEDFDSSALAPKLLPPIAAKPADS